MVPGIPAFLVIFTAVELIVSFRSAFWTQESNERSVLNLIF